MLLLYSINAILLILHEMDSTACKEWQLFHIKGGKNIFLLLHIPIYALLLYGFYLLALSSPAGIIFYYSLAAIGIFAFSIHFYFIHHGDVSFATPFSKNLLRAILFVSCIQIFIIILEKLS